MNVPTAEDAQWMRYAIDLARRPQAPPHPNPYVGAVVVHQGRILGQGWHAQAGSAHAEIIALEAACGDGELAQATLYVTLEPCSTQGKTPPCVDSIIRSGIKRVVFGMEDPNPAHCGRGLRCLEQAGIATVRCCPDRILEKMNQGFIHRCTHGRPWTVAKIAMSLDGKLALADGQSQWITCAKSREDVQDLRALSDVIITGKGTVEHDDPLLTVRDGRPSQAQPLRVVCARTPLDIASYRIAQTGPVMVSDLALPELLLALGRMEKNHALVEAGPRLFSSFYRMGLLDELQIYMAPRFLGVGACNVLDYSVQSLDLAPYHRVLSCEPVGECVKLRLGLKEETCISTPLNPF